MKCFIYKHYQYLVTIIAVLLVFLGLQVTIQGATVIGSSMEPNFETGQRLVVNKIIYKFEEIKRGDIVILHPPYDTNEDYIKRVIGLPGETIEIKNGLVYIDGEPLSEPYISNPPSYTAKKIEVPQEHYFVLGDNRNNSNDSHIWGPVSQDHIIGKVWLSIWPPSDWGIVPN